MTLFKVVMLEVQTKVENKSDLHHQLNQAQLSMENNFCQRKDSQGQYYQMSMNKQRSFHQLQAILLLKPKSLKKNKLSSSQTIRE